MLVCEFYVPLHSQTNANGAGCSSARLEYASGGRVVAGSNPVIPTRKMLLQTLVEAFFFSLNTFFNTFCATVALNANSEGFKNQAFDLLYLKMEYCCGIS